MSRVYDEIYDFTSKLAIIDTHEHLPHREDAREQDTDVLQEYMTQYFARDMRSAGLPIDDFETAKDHRVSLMKRWDLIAPYWRAAENTGYGRSLNQSIEALYGIKRVDRSTIGDLNDAFMESLKGGQYHKVLREKSNIKISLLDSNLDCDQTYFRSVFRMDPFIFPKTSDDVVQIEKAANIDICSFEDWLEACEIVLEQALERGAVALKSGLAYERSLRYDNACRHDAEKAFNRVIRSLRSNDWIVHTYDMGKDFQDYMMHFILRMANKRRLVYQFHTGLLQGSGNDLRNSNPEHLMNLFHQYPHVKFDVFHIGYPYQHVMSAMAKMFPNVYLDMCWAHIISPTASVNALVEWLDSVPVNKISAFGGDYCFIDGVYGHQLMARQNVSKALSIKVEDGVFEMEQAKAMAKMLFYDNPKRIFAPHLDDF